MNKKYIFLLSFFTFLFATSIVLAQDPFVAPKEDVFGFNLGYIMGNIADMVWYVFAGLAIIMFLIAGIKFLTAQGDVKKVSEARQAVIWGIVGVIVGLLAGGIINFVARLMG